MLYLNALLPPWYYRLSAAARPVALARKAVRPVAVSGRYREEALLRDSRYLSRPPRISQRGSDLTKWGWGQRLSGETEKLAFGIRAVLEDRPDFVVWKLDLRSAFNEFSRALLTQRFAEAPPPIRRLLPFVCALLGPSAPLARHGRHVGRLRLGAWKAHSRAARSGRHCSACGLNPT
jgi:hypothetical protein